MLARPTAAAAGTGACACAPASGPRWVGAVLAVLLCCLAGSGEALNAGPEDPLPVRQVALPLTLTEDGLHYYATVNVGSPSQGLQLNIDTGNPAMTVFEPPFCVAAPEDDDSGSDATTGSAPGPCFDKNASSTIQPSNFTEIFTLRLDGEVVRSPVGEPYRVYHDHAALPFVLAGSSSEADAVNVSFLLAPSVSIAPREGVSTAMHTLAFSHGILGASYGGATPFVELLRTLVVDGSWQNGLPLFSLDFGDTSGSLDVGVAPEYLDSLVWGERGNPAGTLYHTLTVHDLEICGNAVTSNTSLGSTRPALIDTGASCLTLPGELFDAVVAYAPLECDTADTCFVGSDAAATSLPTLSFALSAGGPRLYLSLSELALESQVREDFPEGQRRICLLRGSGDMVSLGARALRSLYATFHMGRQQVALANKLSGRSDNQCRENVRCEGMQWRDITTNTCRDPKCGDYFFFETNHEDKTCRLSTAFHVTAVVMILAVFGGELFLFEWGNRLAARVVKSVSDA